MTAARGTGGDGAILAVGHRGSCDDHPENTAAAFDAALAGGAGGIELDLRLTADGRVVICHDADLSRFAGGRRPISRQSLAELSDVDMGSWFSPRFASERLLTLEELLKRYAPRATLLLELKTSAGVFGGRINRQLCEATVAAVARAKAHDRVMVLCFSSTLLAEVARLDPRLRLVHNCMLPPRRLDAWLSRRPPLHAIDVDRRRLTRPFVKACHAAGLRVFTWSCNEAVSADRALSAGVDGILSDRPAWLVAHLARRRR